jgi:hypothetical protein
VTIVLAFLSAISTVAAAGALVFAWLTLRDGRASRREDAYERELDRLYHVLDLVGHVAVVAREGEFTQEGAVAQLRLDAVIAARPELRACQELAEAPEDGVFDAYLEAREEVSRSIEMHLATAPESIRAARAWTT